MNLRNCWLPLLLLVLPSTAWANCSFSGSGTSALNIALPASLGIARDAPVGTELWSSGWVAAPGVRISCSGSGYGSGVLASGIGSSPVPGFTNAKGRPYVYPTNVPGIGISVYFAESPWGDGDYNNASPLTSRSSVSIPGAGTYDWSSGLSWWVRLVKTGSVPAGGQVTVTGTSTAGVHNLVIARLSISGSATVAPRACEVGVDSKNILVPLPTVAGTDFRDGMTVLTDSSKARAFNIDLQCDTGVAVHYQIDGTQTSTVDNVLANAVGPGMAGGVGVQLFRGDTSSTIVQPLGTKLIHATTTADQTISIPLAAKYYQTTPLASGVTPGQVSATATFTMSYE